LKYFYIKAKLGVQLVIKEVVHYGQEVDC